MSERMRTALRWGRRVVAAPVAAPLGMFRLARPRQRRRPPPGSRPGAFAIAEDSPPPRVHRIAYSAERFEEHDVDDLRSLAGRPRAEGVEWIDVQGFGDEAALQRLAELFGIHPLAMADVVNVPQRPKGEAYGDVYLVVTRMVQLRPESGVSLEQVSLVLGPGWVLTFQERPEDVFDPVRARLRAGVGIIRRMGVDYLAYALLDAVIDGYSPVVESLGEALDELEEEVMGVPRQESVRRVHHVRRMLLGLHRTLWRQRDALNSMLRDEDAPFSDAVRIYLRDAYDHAVQALDMVETYREMAVGLMDIYLSNVSNRMNEVMKTLTVMASIFIPLTFIVGVYGMNFQDMPELRWRFGYVAVWGLMLAIALGLVVWFRRRGWIGDADPDDDSEE